MKWQRWITPRPSGVWGIAAVVVGLVLACVIPVVRREKQSGGPTATTIIVNGRVWTGVKGAADAEAVAISGPRIALVGSNDAVRALAGAGTRVIDAGGRRVIPGITDSHTHFLDAGLQLARLDLRDVPDREAFVKAVADAANGLSPGEWLLGGQYTVESWPVVQTPRKEWIDQHTAANPVFLTRTDGHQALVNSPALQQAGITRTGPADPPGGEIERDAETGEPTGILKDAAMDLAAAHVPAPSAAEKQEALGRACRAANAWGITSIHDMSAAEDLATYQSAQEQAKLTVRVHSYVSAGDFEAAWPAIEKLGIRSDLLRVCGLKAFMDGSLGSRTAYMREPYSDAGPGDKYPRGLRSAEAADLTAFERQLRWAHERGVQLAVHAIGDEAIHELLNLYANLPSERERRYRIEHAQHLLPEDTERFAELGVVASMQPFHKADDGRWAEQAIGPERSLTSYAWGSLLKSRAVVCFGSDMPVVTGNPFAGMAAAVSGRTLKGKVWAPSENITIDEALRAYTVAPPYAVFREKELGTLEPGKLADVVILTEDVLDAPAERLAATESWLTMVGGKVVRQRR